MLREQEGRDLAQHLVTRFVAELIVDRFEAIDVHEQQRQRNPVAAVPLQLAADDLVEEAAVAAAGERIGDHHAPQLALRGLEPAVGAAQLERHVLERHELHAERADEIRDHHEEER